jgi:hypothetical protein
MHALDSHCKLDITRSSQFASEFYLKQGETRFRNRLFEQGAARQIKNQLLYFYIP